MLLYLSQLEAPERLLATVLQQMKAGYINTYICIIFIIISMFILTFTVGLNVNIFCALYKKIINEALEIKIYFRKCFFNHTNL